MRRGQEGGRGKEGRKDNQQDKLYKVLYRHKGFCVHCFEEEPYNLPLARQEQ